MYRESEVSGLVEQLHGQRLADIDRVVARAVEGGLVVRDLPPAARPHALAVGHPVVLHERLLHPGLEERLGPVLVVVLEHRGEELLDLGRLVQPEVLGLVAGRRVDLLGHLGEGLVARARGVGRRLGR